MVQSYRDFRSCISGAVVVKACGILGTIGIEGFLPGLDIPSHFCRRYVDHCRGQRPVDDYMEGDTVFGNVRCPFWISQVQGWIAGGLCRLLDGLFQVLGGLVERRSNWLVRFIDDLEKSGWLVDIRRFHEFHGRLGFMAQAVFWVRPFLSAGYAWLAAVKKGGVLTVPSLVQFCCQLIQEKLKMGLRTYSCRLDEEDVGQVFRTDAKCEPGKVVLGGWCLNNSGKTTDAPWFSISITFDQCHWLFDSSGNSSWASTSAELLASLAAVVLFEPWYEKAGVPMVGRVVIHGGVDKKATGFLALKGVSTKTPLLGVLMEHLHQAESRNIRCILDWRPRDTNVEADSLTNLDFKDFKAENRLDASWEKLDLPILKGCAHLLQRFKDSIKIQGDPISSRIKFQKTVWE